jgi:hypothetical protein
VETRKCIYGCSMVCCEMESHEVVAVLPLDRKVV